LLEVVESNPAIGIVGSALESSDGESRVGAHQMIRPFSELLQGAHLNLLYKMFPRHVVSPPRRDGNHHCEWVSGAAMMIRREVFEQIGLLDEGYFLYFDEVDFCFRAIAAGWQVWHVPQSRVQHLEGAATGIRQAGRRARYWHESRRRFFVKSYGVAGLVFADLCWTIGRLSLHVRRLFGLGGSLRGEPRWITSDILWGDIKAIVTGRAFQIAPREGRT